MVGIIETALVVVYVYKNKSRILVSVENHCDKCLDTKEDKQ